METQEPKKISPILRIKFNESEIEAVLFLMKQNLCDTPQELLRHLIRTAHRDAIDNRMRYGKDKLDFREKRQAKADSVRASIDEIKAMSDDELNAHLLAIGYFTPDGLLDPESMSSERIRADRIITLEGERYYYQYHFEPGQKKPVYERMVFNLDELIKDLQKEKLI